MGTTKKLPVPSEGDTTHDPRGVVAVRDDAYAHSTGSKLGDSADAYEITLRRGDF